MGLCHPVWLSEHYIHRFTPPQISQVWVFHRKSQWIWCIWTPSYYNLRLTNSIFNWPLKPATFPRPYAETRVSLLLKLSAVALGHCAIHVLSAPDVRDGLVLTQLFNSPTLSQIKPRFTHAPHLSPSGIVFKSHCRKQSVSLLARTFTTKHLPSSCVLGTLCTIYKISIEVVGHFPSCFWRFPFDAASLISRLGLEFLLEVGIWCWRHWFLVGELRPFEPVDMGSLTHSFITHCPQQKIQRTLALHSFTFSLPLTLPIEPTRSSEKRYFQTYWLFLLVDTFFSLERVIIHRPAVCLRIAAAVADG